MDKNIKDILKSISSEKNRKLLQELYVYNEVTYNGFEYIQDGLNISDSVQKLKEQGVVDYDEYSGTLALEYQTDDYFKYLTDTSNDTNIEDIKRKQVFINKKLEHIRQKKESAHVHLKTIENVKALKESKDIQKALRSIPSIINKNYIALNNNSLFAFKVEENLQIKINILEECKTQLKELATALDKIERFLKKLNKTFLEILPNPLLLDKLRADIILYRKTILSARETTSYYLAKTLKDGDFIKKLNKISLLIKENQLAAKTNFYDVVDIAKCTIEKKNFSKKIDIELGNYYETIDDRYTARVLKENTKQVKKDEKVYTPVNKNKPDRVLKMVKPSQLYEQFKKDILFDNLIDFLYSKDLNSSNINSLVATFVIKWHSSLLINKKKTIQRNGYVYPFISRRF